MIYELIRTITSSLEEKRIPYMISGSLAFNIYCIPRMSMDIDMVIELNLTNVNDFFNIFSTGYYIDQDTVIQEIKNHGMFNIIDHRSGFKIDFMIRKNTEYRQLEFSRKVRKVLLDIPVWMVSPEDLIISKLAWIQELQSGKQSQDIMMLQALPEIDRDYIDSWCKKLNLKTFGLIKLT
jgi:hypothetical protein